jgi:hypothetical protein
MQRTQREVGYTHAEGPTMGDCSSYKTDRKNMNVFARFVSGYIVPGRRSRRWLYIVSTFSESHFAVVVLNWKILFDRILALMRNFLYKLPLNAKLSASSRGGRNDGKIRCASVSLTNHEPCLTPKYFFSRSTEYGIQIRSKLCGNRDQESSARGLLRLIRATYKVKGDGQLLSLNSYTFLTVFFSWNTRRKS